VGKVNQSGAREEVEFHASYDVGLVIGAFHRAEVCHAAFLNMHDFLIGDPPESRSDEHSLDVYLSYGVSVHHHSQVHHSMG
jgi:hypothetical protein